MIFLQPEFLLYLKYISKHNDIFGLYFNSLISESTFRRVASISCLIFFLSVSFEISSSAFLFVDIFSVPHVTHFLFQAAVHLANIYVHF